MNGLEPLQFLFCIGCGVKLEPEKKPKAARVKAVCQKCVAILKDKNVRVAN